MSGNSHPSSVMKLSRMIVSRDPTTGRDQNVFYRSGIGSQQPYPGKANQILRWVDRWFGGTWGAGFEAGVEAAAETLMSNYIEGDRVFLFGYSRGAAQLRALTHFIDWLGGLPEKCDGHFLPSLFNHYLQGDTVIPLEERLGDFGGKLEPASTQIQIRSRDGDKTTAYDCGNLRPIQIELLAALDTVMALGSRFRANAETSVTERCHYIGKTPARCVKNALQALAVDEKRWDFSPEVWAGHLDGQTLEQRWFAGTHSDLGGGHDDDGLANIPFQWFAQSAKRLGLVCSSKILSIGSGVNYWPQIEAKLHESMTLGYRVGEWVRFRVGKGIRNLEGYSKGANIKLDKSIVYRINRYKPSVGEHPYRPKNVLSLLDKRNDPNAEELDTCLDLFTEALNHDPRSKGHRPRKGSEF